MRSRTKAMSSSSKNLVTASMRLAAGGLGSRLSASGTAPLPFSPGSRAGLDARRHTGRSTGVLRGRIGARPPHSQTGLPDLLLERRKAEVHDYERFGRLTLRIRKPGACASICPAVAESPLAQTTAGVSF